MIFWPAVLLCPPISGASSVWCSLDSHLQSSRLISPALPLFFSRPAQFVQCDAGGRVLDGRLRVGGVGLLSSPTTSTVHDDVNGSTTTSTKTSASVFSRCDSHPPTRRKRTSAADTEMQQQQQQQPNERLARLLRTNKETPPLLQTLPVRLIHLSLNVIPNVK